MPVELVRLFTSVKDNNNQIGLFDRHERLFSNGRLDRFARPCRKASGVYQDEIVPRPIRLGIMPVARDPARVVDDGLPAADNAIKKRGLAHVRPPDYGNDWEHK